MLVLEVSWWRAPVTKGQGQGLPRWISRHPKADGSPRELASCRTSNYCRGILPACSLPVECGDDTKQLSIPIFHSARQHTKKNSMPASCCRMLAQQSSPNANSKRYPGQVTRGGGEHRNLPLELEMSGSCSSQHISQSGLSSMHQRHGAPSSARTESHQAVSTLEELLPLYHDSLDAVRETCGRSHRKSAESQRA